MKVLRSFRIIVNLIPKLQSIDFSMSQLRAERTFDYGWCCCSTNANNKIITTAIITNSYNPLSAQMTKY